MEIFLTGAIFALVGTVAFLTVAYRKGWLNRLFLERRNNNREEVEKFITKLRRVRSIMLTFADGHKDPDQLADSIRELRVKDMEAYRDTIEGLIADISRQATEISQIANYAIALVNKKARLKPEPEQPAYSTTTKVETPPSVSNSTAFAENVLYVIRSSAPGSQPMYATGAQINEMIVKGAKLGSDFFVMGTAAEVSAAAAQGFR